MSTITLQAGGISEFYEDGVLIQVLVHYLLEHPVHGDQAASTTITNLNAWAHANDNGKQGLIRAAVQQAGSVQSDQLDATPVHTGAVLADDLFGDPIEL